MLVACEKQDCERSDQLVVELVVDLKQWFQEMEHGVQRQERRE